MTYTPGPWTTVPTSHGGLIVVRGGALEHPQHMLQIVPEADARLIASAPDLLEALKWFVANDDTNEGDEPMPEYDGLSWNEINAFWLKGLNKARAAIAKAQEMLP